MRCDKGEVSDSSCLATPQNWPRLAGQSSCGVWGRSWRVVTTGTGSEGKVEAERTEVVHTAHRGSEEDMI